MACKVGEVLMQRCCWDGGVDGEAIDLIERCGKWARMEPVLPRGRKGAPVDDRRVTYWC